MIRLQHRHRREGIILVGDTKYRLDADGCVEVTDEHAGWMMQGDWAAPGTHPVLPAALPLQDSGRGRTVRTKEQLAAMAAAEGLVLPPSPPPAPTSQPEPALQRAPAPGDGPGGTDIIEISNTTSRAELMRVAKQLGIHVPRTSTQAQVFALLQAQAQGDEHGQQKNVS